MLSKFLVGCNIHCSFLMRRAHAFHAATRSKIPSGSGLSAWVWFGMLKPWFHAHFTAKFHLLVFGCRFAWSLLVTPIGYWLTPLGEDVCWVFTLFWYFLVLMTCCGVFGIFVSLQCFMGLLFHISMKLIFCDSCELQFELFLTLQM